MPQSLNQKILVVFVRALGSVVHCQQGKVLIYDLALLMCRASLAQLNMISALYLGQTQRMGNDWRGRYNMPTAADTTRLKTKKKTEGERFSSSFIFPHLFAVCNNSLVVDSEILQQIN